MAAARVSSNCAMSLSMDSTLASSHVLMPCFASAISVAFTATAWNCGTIAKSVSFCGSCCTTMSELIFVQSSLIFIFRLFVGYGVKWLTDLEFHLRYMLCGIPDGLIEKSSRLRLQLALEFS